MTGVRVQLGIVCGSTVPLGDLARRLRRQQRPDDVPAVLGEVAAVEELQLARQDRIMTALRVLGRQDEGRPAAIGSASTYSLWPVEIERRVALELPDPLLGR
jgi:hypothetical protein